MSRLNLLWAGEFSSRKRPLDAIAVMSQLVELVPHARLRMVGDGPLHPLVLGEIHRRGLGGVIAAEGRSDVARSLSEAHLLLHTAAWEGLPRVMLEAAAVGRYTYGYDVKGVVDGPASRVVPLGEASALAAAIAGDYRKGALDGPPTVNRADLSPQAAAVRIAEVVTSVVAGSGRRNDET
jgi:glycosyltransferase involved in cell wall biosynthesis